ncbi:15253_t:CDS:1, partial [Gigaspora rosea]
AEMLNGVDASRIHARLFDLAPNSDREFTPIIDSNRTQFVCEAYPFRFFVALDDVKSYLHGTSKWTDK